MLALAFATFNVFAYQTVLVPQVRDYQPSWHGARWITAQHADRPVAYFRKTVALPVPPTGAFVTVQASQAFTLYANGQLVDKSRDDFMSGATTLAYTYDVTALLQSGPNTIALCAVNFDEGAPIARAVFGVSYGDQAQTFPSDTSWVATDDPQLVDAPCSITQHPKWSRSSFADGVWQSAADVTGSLPADGVLHVSPAAVETPLPTAWLAAGPGEDAFFFRSLRLPAVCDAWLRVASSGDAQIYVNGERLADQPDRIRVDQNGHTLPSAIILTASLYEVSPYLHAGANDLGVHVSTVGTDLKTGAPRTRPAAALLDLLVTSCDGTTSRFAGDGSWLGSATAAPGWMKGGDAAARWSFAIPTSAVMFLPAAKHFAVQPSLVPATNRVSIPGGAAARVLLVTTLLLLAGLIATVGAQLVVRRGFGMRARLVPALDRVALALLPALALMLLLFVLNLEPLIPRPFPFTRLWLAIVAGTALAALALMLASARLADAIVPVRRALARHLRHLSPAPAPALPRWLASALPARLRARLSWQAAATAAAVVAMLLVGAYMVTYNLAYEVYWQDEVTSVYAAMGVLHGGVPRMLSGYIYEKAELFSYMLAGPIALFGTGPIATRALSVVEYLLSLALTYWIGRYFLGKRVGLLAMLLVVASPMALRWGREARMYQQAELTALIFVYLFYRAVQPGARVRYIYLSMLAVVVMYLSHEETFILLPAVVVYFLVTQRLTWVRNAHWWLAGCGAIAAILFQLYLTKATHPPVLGTDSTQQPLIAFSPENLDFYLRLLFDSRSLSHGTLAELGITSTFAVLAALGALFSSNRTLRYLSLFLSLPLIMLAFTFTLTSDRYIYPLLPVFAFLAAAAMSWMFDRVWFLARRRLGAAGGRAVVAAFALLLTLTVLAAQTPSMANFGLATSRTFGIAAHHRYPDYQRAGDYIRAHWQPGDILITISPAIDGAFYAERPSFLLYQSKALYLFEQNGHIVDTPTGSTVLLNGHDLDTVLATYHRIWLLSVPSYQCCGRTDNFPLAGNFQLLFEGADTLVYLRSA